MPFEGARDARCVVYLHQAVPLQPVLAEDATLQQIATQPQTYLLPESNPKPALHQPNRNPAPGYADSRVTGLEKGSCQTDPCDREHLTTFEKPYWPQNPVKNTSIYSMPPPSGSRIPEPLAYPQGLASFVVSKVKTGPSHIS